MTESKKILTKRDINRLGFRSIIYLNSVFNYQKMQAHGWTTSMAPALKKIYKDDDQQLAQALEDNSEFINTNTNLSSFLMGLLISLEEKKEDRKLINGLKVGLFAPLAGIGDAIFWFTLLPIIAGICASMAIKGNVFGPILFFILYIGIAFSRIALTRFGYKLGESAIDKITSLSATVTEAALILGTTVIGGLMSSYISLPIAWKIAVAKGKTISIQKDLLDNIFPGILPICVTLLLYYLLKKKNANPVVLIALLLVVCIAGSFIGLF